MDYEKLVGAIANVHTAAQVIVAKSIDSTLTLRNWAIGAYLIEYEQNGEDRAAYGSKLMATLAADFKKQGIKGLSDRNLKNFRQFAITYPNIARNHIASTLFPDSAEIRQTVSAESANALPQLFPSLQERAGRESRLPWQNEDYYQRLLASLSWSHLLELTRIDDRTKRAFYELECMKSNWSLRELKRQIESMLYERVGLSKDKNAVIALANQGQIVTTPQILLRDPYILEFLELEEKSVYSESDLEQQLIDHLQQFMLELGRDFCFIGRQFRITVAGEHYYIDLLFYHRLLQCLIAIDLKLGKFNHQDAGQMNFYLNYLKENEVHPHENPPVGIILCAEKDVEAVHYATAGMDDL